MGRQVNNMARYIDADALLEEFDPNGELLDPIAVRMRIVTQPTAFDVEKVVQELEGKSLRCKMESARLFCEEDYIKNTVKQGVKQSNDMQAFAYDMAIEIVKAGGIDEQID